MSFVRVYEWFKSIKHDVEEFENDSHPKRPPTTKTGRKIDVYLHLVVEAQNTNQQYVVGLLKNSVNIPALDCTPYVSDLALRDFFIS